MIFNVFAASSTSDNLNIQYSNTEPENITNNNTKKGLTNNIFTYETDNVDIIINSKNSGWIDLVSSDPNERIFTVNYTVFHNDFNKTIVPIITNKYYSYALKPLKVFNNGCFVWDGKINDKVVNQAYNPYTINLVLFDLNGKEIARSKPTEIFVGRPVILLHGLFQTSGYMNYTLLYYVLSQSYYTISGEYLPYPASAITSGFGNIKKYGSILKTKVEQIKKSTGAKKVDIIGYSMGGLVARWYAQECGGGPSIGKIIMMGTPNHGAESAVSFHKYTLLPEYSNMALCQMFPGSDFLMKLNSNEDNFHLLPYTYITIAGTNDLLVQPESVKLKGVHSIIVDARHITLPFIKSVTSEVKTILGRKDDTYKY